MCTIILFVVVFIFSYQFRKYFNYISGSEEGTWFIDMKNGSGAVGKGKSPTSADATLSMDTSDFFKMFTGTYCLKCIYKFHKSDSSSFQSYFDYL